MLLLCLPICLVAYPILKIWLGIVPDYSVEFLQIVTVQSLFQVFDTSFYTALYAKGRLSENAQISPSIGFLTFPVVYIMFRMGYSPLALSWAFLINYALLGLIVKPVLIVRIANYKWSEIAKVYIDCAKVSLASAPIPCMLYYFQHQIWGENIYISLVVITIVSVMSVMLSVWLFGLSTPLKEKIKVVVRNKIVKKAEI